MRERTGNISLAQTDIEEISNCGTVTGYQEEGCLLPFGAELKQFEMLALPEDFGLSNIS